MYKLLSTTALVLSLIITGCSSGSDHGINFPASTPVEPTEPTEPVELTPLPDYAKLQQAYIDATVESGRSGIYSAVLLLSQGVAPDPAGFQHGLEEMNSRDDTADFNLPGLLNILYKEADNDALSADLHEQIRSSVVNFKYWPDELEEVVGTTDNLNMVSWTENHFILFASGGYLAGQLYPDQVFPASGETGREKMVTFKPRIMRWLELRYRSGLNEWMSNVYYNEDMPALLALIELAEDQELVERARMVLDLMMADMALNNFRGNFGASHGRTYTHKESGHRDSTRAAMNLLFGLNEQDIGNMTASLLAGSEKYRMPEVLYRIANDVEREAMENHQRIGINLEDAADWGLDPNVLEDGMTFLTMEAYTHPLMIDLFYEMLNAYEWWDYRDFAPFKEYKEVMDSPELRASVAASFEWDITRNMRPEVNLVSYRTPKYMLSTAQDWRKGYGGDQQSIWQATLGMDAVAFTTHPAKESESGGTPSYWVGYGTLPRAVQVKNVVVSIYDVETREGIYYGKQPLYTHAYLPRARFEETLKEQQWFFAHQGDAYLALWSSDPAADWITSTDPDRAGGGDYEIIANGEKTIWICELGDADEYGDFAAFRSAILNAPLDADAEALTVNYQSPSQGSIEMAWEGPVLNNDSEVQTRNYPRYGNTYSDAPFPGEDISFTFGDSYLRLNFENGVREASAYLD